MSTAYESKIALITGANKGIGFEIARQLGEQGFMLLLGARDSGRGREAGQRLQAEQIDTHVLQLDVTDQETINTAADFIEREFGRLDILINNAGILIDENPPSQLALETLRRTYETNVFGAFAVTKAMLPLLRKSSGGRIVNVSSSLGSLTLNSDPDWEFAQFQLLAYNSSKAALNAMTIQFANELKGTSIKVNAADPGYTATDLNGHSGPQTIQQAAVVSVRLAMLPPDGPTGGFFNERERVPW